MLNKILLLQKVVCPEEDEQKKIGGPTFLEEVYQRHFGEASDSKPPESLPSNLSVPPTYKNSYRKQLLKRPQFEKFKSLIKRNILPNGK